MILNPWRTLPFIAQLHLQPPKIRFVLPLKTPRSNLVVFHMREEKFFIIRPTKADNLHKQSLDPILVSIRTHASIFNSTKNLIDTWKWSLLSENLIPATRAAALAARQVARVVLLWEAATWARGPGRACHFWPRLDPAAQAARVVLFSSETAISIHVLMAILDPNNSWSFGYGFKTLSCTLHWTFALLINSCNLG